MPFSRAEFFWIFARYNDAVWPAQIVLNALAVSAAFLAFRRSVAASRAANMILAALWLWMAVAYHAAFFVVINPLAIGFAVVFGIQSLLFISLAFEPEPIYRPKRDFAGLAGALLIVFSLAIYPALSVAAGHAFPAQPTFGLPCPTTIFTLGMLLWAAGIAPKRLFIIPVLWTAIATVGAVQLGVIEDVSLPVAAVAAIVVVFFVNRRMHPWPMPRRFLVPASPVSRR
jgi:hypothetical protein